ncbi:MAG: DUF4180 domain-containing protein [Firmicutes bacterium]|nr:DUF4180 domain-containing protein [Bacillota bacterium]
MKIERIKEKGVDIAIVRADGVLISDVQSALDLVATVAFTEGGNRIVMPKSVLAEDFFNLRTRLAGEMLQKFINYQVKVAIVGDFSTYTSKSLKDFIYESNQGKDIFFVADEKQAIEKLVAC